MKKILLLLLLPIFSFGQTINSFPWVNDFELSIGLEQEINDDGDWVTWQGPTYSYNTGPSGDHTTGSGIYYYVESSYPNYPNQTFTTYTPTFDVSATPGKVLSFWYHMYGTAMGDLEIGVLDSNGYTVLDNKSGNYGDQWFFAYYPIASTDSFKIQFTAVTGDSYTSDIAIDDLMISDPFSPAVGCMDSMALNYDSSAVYPDGSCTYPPCGGFISSNAYEQCWGVQTGITFEWWSDTTTTNCDVIEVHYGNENGPIYSYGGYWPAADGYGNFAFNAGNGQMPPNWSVEHYIVLEYADGTLSDTISYTPSPCIPGCMDSTQVAYNPFANIDNGSCLSTTCDTATEYQISMEIKLDNWPGEVSWSMVTNSSSGTVVTPTGTYDFNDIGQTYTYDFCVSNTAGFEFIINDTYGDGMAGNGTPGAAGEVVIYDCAGDTITYLSSGTWVDGSSNPVGVNFGSVAYSTPQVGIACASSSTVLGCLDPMYQEFNPLANVSDSSCASLHIFGCMDTASFNYDSTATQVDLIPVCDYTLIIEDDAADGWGNSYIGVAQGNNTWTYTMGPGSYSQSFPIDLETDKPVKVYYLEVPGAQQSDEEVQFQTMQNSFLLINADGDTLLSEGTNPFSNNGQDALQPFEPPFWVIYSALPSCGDYCEPFIVGCMDSIAFNYNDTANTAGTCYYSPGCTNSAFLEYYTQGFVADTNDGSCLTAAIWGCTDAAAFNYDASANVDNGGCVPVVVGCMVAGSFNYNPQANTSGPCTPIIYGCTSPIAYNYNPSANTDDGSCEGVVYGCMDPDAFNYDPNANIDDGSCVATVYGCTDATMFNYDPLANVDNGSCEPYVYGCMDSTMFNYNPLANADNGSCIPFIYGCTDPSMLNYNPQANTEDFSCIAYVYGCMDSVALNYNPLANTDNGSCIEVVYGCMDPGAHNYDSIANTSDSLSCLYSANCITGAGNPYWLNDPCYAWVISVDDYCCQNEWDTICQLTYDYCDSTYIGPIPARENLDNYLVVYPNPTSDKININKNVDINVYNYIGSMIISKKNINILNVSKLSPGIYMLQINYKNKTITKQLIKK